MILSHFIIIIQVCFQGNLKLKQTLCPVRRHSFRNIHNEANIIILQTNKNEVKTSGFKYFV